ncbi:MAG TPA: glycosyltransferase [Pyrinomonadaceae bacterium]|nr:glycosyltransferase [Pyrinomonadaceae bacterium]
MLRDASIICLSSIDWSFNRQNPQEVALALAEDGSRVLFVDNTGVRRPELRDAPRLWSRLRNWWGARGGTSRVAGGVDVFSPLLLPLPYSRPAVSANARLLTRAIRTWLGGNNNGGGPLIVVTFLPTPLARGVIKALRPALVVYYCIDLLAESSPGARRLTHSERRLLAESDLVLVTSGLLYEAAAEVSTRVEMLASGVHAERFDEARRSHAGPPEALSSLSGPVVGYVGSIRTATDLSLLARAAELAPDLQFVLAGPRFVDVAPLAERPNVRLLGAVRHEEIARYMVRFDVGVLPYSINKFTAGIMPVKLKEYLAAGLPVVATPLPEVVRFAEHHPGLVRFAGNPEDFVAALRASLSDGEPEAQARRVAVARQFDWNRQMGRMKELIEQALARET